MYSSQSIYSTARQINYHSFNSKGYTPTRNESKGLSNYCLHSGNQKLPDCSICRNSEAGREMMDKHSPELHIPTYGSNIKSQYFATNNTAQCPPSPLADSTLTNNKRHSDKTVSGGQRQEPPTQSSAINTNSSSCNLCNKIFSQVSHCDNHEESTDKNQLELATSQFKNNIYSDLVAHKTNQQSHSQTRLDPKTFVCSQCPKMFAQRTNLKNHERVHSGEKPYKCDVCQRSFSQRGNLNTHRRTHGGEKEFVCEVCLKAFSQKGNLKNHARTHTGERPYHCKECGKTFGQHTDLCNHERVHTGEKPFVCTVCSKAFSQRANLKIHGRTHTGEKPFGCSICGKNFSQKGNLKCHLKTHCCDKTVALFT